MVYGTMMYSIEIKLSFKRPFEFQVLLQPRVLESVCREGKRVHFFPLLLFEYGTPTMLWPNQAIIILCQLLLVGGYYYL